MTKVVLTGRGDRERVNRDSITLVVGVLLTWSTGTIVKIER